jgi:hypothetical protein
MKRVMLALVLTGLAACEDPTRPAEPSATASADKVGVVSSGSPYAVSARSSRANVGQQQYGRR